MKLPKNQQTKEVMQRCKNMKLTLAPKQSTIGLLSFKSAPDSYRINIKILDKQKQIKYFKMYDIV